MNEADLNKLLSRVATGGDMDAFAEFYDATCDRVYGMTLRVLRDPGYSEEATQETFLAVWRNAETYDPGPGPHSPGFSPWRIAGPSTGCVRNPPRPGAPSPTASPIPVARSTRSASPWSAGRSPD